MRQKIAKVLMQAGRADLAKVMARTRTVDVSAIALADRLRPSRAGVSKRIEEIVSTEHSRTIAGKVPSTSMLQSFVDLFKEIDVDFALIGGMAMLAHGHTRSTRDVDILAAANLGRKLGDPLIAKYGFTNASSRRGKVWSLVHRKGTGEVFVAHTDTQVKALETAQPMNVQGRSIPVVSAPAIIALKFVALSNDPTRLKKDLSDIAFLWPDTDAAHVKHYLSESQWDELAKLLPKL